MSNMNSRVIGNIPALPLGTSLPPPRDEDGFALLPDDGRPVRLIRYIDMPDIGILSMLDRGKNILRVNRPQYELLSEHDKNRLAITHAPTTSITDTRDGGVTFVEYPYPNAIQG